MTLPSSGPASGADAAEAARPADSVEAATIRPPVPAAAPEPATAADATAGATTAAEWSDRPDPAEVRLGDGFGFAAKVFLAVWLGWSLLGLLGVLTFPAGTPVGVPGLDADPLTPGWHNFFTVGQRADALWYQRIANDGYRLDDASAAFFPLYPMAIYLLSSVPGFSTFVAASLIAQACLFGSLVVLYSLAEREFGTAVARRATCYLAVFPTAFFFLAPYTEAPFLLLVLLAFWFARGNRWMLAVIPATLAGLTRSVGIVLAAALVVEAISQWRAGRGLLPRLAAGLSPLVGLGAYFLYWAVVHGRPMAPVQAQENWGRETTFPLLTLWNAVKSAYLYQSYWLIDLLVVGVVIVAVLAGVRLLRPSYLTYAVLSLLLPLLEPFPPRPLMSMPRFVAVIFPAILVIAVAVRRGKLADSLVIGYFSAGFAFLALLFMNSHSIF